MDFVKTPTDNLYKFIALFGLAIFGLMCVLVHRHIDQSMNKALELEKELNSQHAALLGIVAEVEKANPDIDVNKLTDSEFSNLVAPSKYQTLIELERQAETNMVVGEAIIKWLKPVLMTYVIIAVIGVFIAIAGFILWYKKLQKHIDKKLEHESQALT